MKSLLLLLLLISFNFLGLAQDTKTKPTNSPFYVLNDPILDQDVTEQYMKLVALLSSEVKNKLSQTLTAIQKQLAKGTSIALCELVQNEVNKQFPLLSKQESDILVFYLIAESHARIKSENEKNKDSSIELSLFDRFVLKQLKGNDQQIVQMISNIMKMQADTIRAIINKIQGN